MDFKHLYVKGFCVELEGIDWLECLWYKLVM